MKTRLIALLAILITSAPSAQARDGGSCGGTTVTIPQTVSRSSAQFAGKSGQQSHRVNYPRVRQRFAVFVARGDQVISKSDSAIRKDYSLTPSQPLSLSALKAKRMY